MSILTCIDFSLDLVVCALPLRLEYPEVSKGASLFMAYFTAVLAVAPGCVSIVNSPQ